MVKMKKAVLFLFVIYSNIFSQYFSGGFNFYLSSADSSSQKFLPNFPVTEIGNDNFVVVDNEGHFSTEGKRIRFWGTNAGADAAFPSKSVANILVGRLRKFGFNLVRMHHLDNPWSPKSLLDKIYTRQLIPENLDLLENFIAQLKENNIYVNMNLHVSRTFRMFDGVTAYDSLPEFSKGVNFFDPYIIKLHKEYAQQLLTHVNPYTGKSLVDDPVMAMVEITNENSLYRFWRENKLKPISKDGVLPVYYSNELDEQWNKFLTTKYQTTDNLRAAWNKGRVAFEEGEQIDNGSFEGSRLKNYWFIEQHNGAIADTSIDRTISHSGNRSFNISVQTATGTEWHIQIKIPNLKVIKDSIYTVKFFAKSNSDKDISVSVMNDVSPYNGYGSSAFKLTNVWKEFSFSFKATETNLSHTRLSFMFGKEAGEYWLDDISLTRAGVAGLEENENLGNKNVSRMDFSACNNFTNQRVKDLSEFYISTERNYFKEMIKYLKDTLGVKVPVVTSNWNTGMSDLAAMSDGDYVDNHAYWDHPNFPNIPWSSTDWLISNTPMAKENGGVIPGLYAGVPVSGKPFTVSEYNHPFPNQYQVESVLFSLGYSSFNDADAFMFFAYDEAQDWNKDKIANYFAINRNPVLMSFFPSIAFAFRNGFIQSSVNPITLNFSADTLLISPKYDSGDWRGFSLFDSKISLNHAVKVGKYFDSISSDFSQLPAAPTNNFVTDTDEIHWNATDGTIYISADKFNGSGGYLYKLRGKRTGNMMIVEAGANDFGVIAWLSLDGKTIGQSNKSLITIGSKVQNMNMVWNSTNTSINNNWGSSPTLIYPLKVRLDLIIEADSIKIYPLDTKGNENAFTSYFVKPYQPNHFIFDIDQNLLRTLWFGIEKYGEGNPSDVKSSELIINKFELHQNYPNPFNPTTTISFTIPSSTEYYSVLQNVSLKVYDILGREVATLINENKPAGVYNLQCTLNNASSGVYFYTLKAGTFSETKKMILTK